jgi:hypothetical protein
MPVSDSILENSIEISAPLRDRRLTSFSHDQCPIEETAVAAQRSETPSADEIELQSNFIELKSTQSRGGILGKVKLFKNCAQEGKDNSKSSGAKANPQPSQ